MSNKVKFRLPDDIWMVDLDSNKLTAARVDAELPLLPEPEGTILKNHLKQVGTLDPCQSIYESLSFNCTISKQIGVFLILNWMSQTRSIILIFSKSQSRCARFIDLAKSEHDADNFLLSVFCRWKLFNSRKFNLMVFFSLFSITFKHLSFAFVPKQNSISMCKTVLLV